MKPNFCRRLPFTEEQIQAILHDYSCTDIPVKKICNKYNVRRDTLSYLRKKYNVSKRITYQQRVAAQAVQDHISGMLLKDVEKKYHICQSVIYDYMKNHNIHYKNGHGRKHHFNEDYFASINTEHKAYWLGFLYADGCVTTSEPSCLSPNRLSINLSFKDRIILEKFLNDINADYAICDYMPNEKTYGNTMMSKIDVNSKKLCFDLIKHGCIPNKTKFLQFPFCSLNENTYPHFLRGLFDGDGSITIGRKKNPSFQITGYPPFLLEVQQILIKFCDITLTKLYRYPKKHDVADLCYSGIINCKKIFNYLYQNDTATIFLPRKYDCWIELIS